MEKLKMHSPDLTDENILRIRELFPGCVTEAVDDNGDLRYAVDFDQLKQELSDHIVDGPQERYHLNWPGKLEALLAANAPIAKTLRPARDESVDFDTTQNLFIEGDNLEALKLLQETYLGKIKLIYIDPPYNTGSDFIYEDDFTESTYEYLISSSQQDDIGNKLVANKESNGRFHSNWLSMMYSRLRLSRNLLAENGVIFISIDEHEADNLKKACDEIFGHDNFLGNICVVSNLKGRSDDKYFATAHNS
ncbi:MAG: site-specific DNA-methyltransferase, partial [Candidatus Sedimenticola sp. 6PFRAG7]